MKKKSATNGLKIFKKKGANGDAASGAVIEIDYPQPNEIIQPGHYALRISARGTGQVEVSINKGDWQPCRQDVGYYWFDWNAQEPGKKKIVARIKSDGKKPKTSGVRECEVLPSR